MKVLQRINGYLTVFFFFVTACKPTVPVRYHELIDHPNCSSPCWIGIEIGKTSFDKAQEVLAEKYGSINLNSRYGESIEWQAQNVDGLSSGFISFHENKAVDMFLIIGDDAELTIDRLIEMLGEPEWVFVNSQPTIHCNYYRLEYPSLGIYGDLEMLNKHESMQASNRIIMLRFIPKRINGDLQVCDGYLVEWDGYKKYCNQQ